jgi:hypothetical protein
MAPENPAQTPGQLLRAARLARGSDMDAAHEGTKIPLRLIEAIERDEYHQLSDGLYIKSFLRNYATWLGLDPGEILALYEQIVERPGNTATVAGGGMVWREDQVEVLRIGTPWLRYAGRGLFGLAVLAAVVWFVFLRPTPDQRPLTGGQEIPHVEPAPAAELLDAELPAAVRGDPRLRFQGGENFALVLRVLLPREANCSVRRDGQAAAAPLIWPEDPLPLPAANLRHGEAYAVQGGFAAYWGANDHLTLILDSLDGAEVTLNGIPQPVADWRPGQPVVLDRAALAADGG